MHPQILVVVYGLTIVAAAMAGGCVPGWIRMTHVRVQMILSFVGGLMLGVAVLHLLPHSVEMTASVGKTTRAMLLGLLAIFFMMRAFHFHHHGDQASKREHPQHHGEAGHKDGPAGGGVFSWLGVAFGLAVHTLIDGVALGSAVLEGQQHTGAWSLPGLGVYLAVLLHKPLDAISVSSLMRVRGASWTQILIANGCLAITCPLGALLVVQGVDRDSATLGYLLAASAGVFLCISLSDLLPEVQFHRHDRLQLSAALLLGIAVAVVMEMQHGH